MVIESVTSLGKVAEQMLQTGMTMGILKGVMRGVAI
jgi:hypothetical protein